MKEKLQTLDAITPSATPTKDEIRRWEALPRDEQLLRMQNELDQAINSGISERSMDDIKKDALKRVAASKND